VVAETFIPRRSSYINAVEYDPQTQDLTVTFADGAVFLYSDVPVAEYQRLTRAPSVGKYFYAFIRDSYSYEQQ
jgi:ABC-type uncharacterized transport system substrate-binding protein